MKVPDFGAARWDRGEVSDADQAPGRPGRRYGRTGGLRLVGLLRIVPFVIVDSHDLLRLDGGLAVGWRPARPDRQEPAHQPGLCRRPLQLAQVQQAWSPAGEVRLP